MIKPLPPFVGEGWDGGELHQSPLTLPLSHQGRGKLILRREILQLKTTLLIK